MGTVSAAVRCLRARSGPAAWSASIVLARGEPNSRASGLKGVGMHEQKLSRRKLIKGAAALGAVSVAAACTPPTTSTPSASATVRSSPTTAPDREIILAYTADLNTMDPALIRGPNEQENALNMYNGLVRYAFNATSVQVEADLAQKWEVSPDGKTWTFTLRQGVQFHKDFGELTSDDVVFHYKRLMDPKTGSQAISDLAPVASVEAPDKYTVRFNMKAPYQNFLEAAVAWRWCMIPSRKAVEQYGADYPNNPIGTGAYVFQSRVPRQEIRWTANQKYWRGAPGIARIKMVVIPEESVGALALRRGEVHAMKVQSPAVYRTLKGDAAVQVAADPAMSWLGCFFNLEKKPFDNIKFRQALATAIDRTAMVTALEGTAVAGYSVIPPAAFGHTTDVPKWEGGATRAKQLLTEAGYPSGGVSFDISVRAEHVAYMEVAAEQWRQIGVTANIKLMESGAFASLVNAPEHNYQVVVGGIGRPTAEQQLVQFNSRSPRLNNYATYKSAQVDTIIDQLAVELDTNKRRTLLADFQKQVANDVPALVMLNQLNIVGYHSSVKGFTRNFVNHILLVEQMALT
jgi:ABC-type transport system substrate-binding protein